MNTSRLTRAFDFVWCAALCCSACSSPLPPSSTIVGDWSGRVSPAHFESIQIRFEQRGSTLVGTACHVSDAHLSFADLPVAVDYPRVSFTVDAQHLRPGISPTLVGMSFSGSFRADDTLRGSFPVSQGNENVALTRSTTQAGTMCADATIR
jgi:hypothetical protein